MVRVFVLEQVYAIKGVEFGFDLLGHHNLGMVESRVLTLEVNTMALTLENAVYCTSIV